jgi:hypothetical protein
MRAAKKKKKNHFYTLQPDLSVSTFDGHHRQRKFENVKTQQTKKKKKKRETNERRTMER